MDDITVSKTASAAKYETDFSVQELLASLQAIITGDHLVYTSGKHGSAYVNKDAIYPHTRQTSYICRSMAEAFAGDRVEAVIAPVIGGVILSQWVAFHLSEISGREVLALYAEKDGAEGFVIKRGYDKLLRSKRVLVVEDILTTGGSVRKVVETTRDLGGEIVGVAAICNRGGVGTSDIGNPPRLFSLVNVVFDTWDANNCPLCAQGIPINVNLGKGREFLASRQK